MRLLAALTLGLAGSSTAVAADCGRAEVVCVPAEATLENAFLDVANGGTIEIAPGTYPSPAGNNGFRLGGQPGSARRNRSFTVRARDGAGTVTLTGQGTRRVVVLDQLAAGRWITFEGLRFVDGRSATGNVAGGVTLKDARATFVDCEFSGHRLALGASGGGALGLYGRAEAIVLRSLFENNRAISEGAAILAQTGAAPYDGPSRIWIQGSTLRNNCETGSLGSCSGGNGGGGAVLVRNSSAVIVDSSFESNRAGWTGGAIYVFGTSSGTSPYCNFAAPSADLYVHGTRFVGNTITGTPVPSSGGAVHLEACARGRFRASLFEDNDAEWGGAIDLFASSLVVTQSVFRNNGNAAPGSEVNVLGGAIAALSSAGTTPPPDHPAARVFVARTLFDGGPAGTVDSQHGGCLAALGDAQQATAGTCSAADTSICAQVTILDSAFFDCDVGLLGGASVPAGGGAVTLTRAYATISGSLFARNDATGTNGRGGGIEALNRSRVDLGTVVFSGNSVTGTGADTFASVDSAVNESDVDHWTASQGGPADGVLLAAPSLRFPATPPGPDETWLVHAWRGSSATLDGVPLPSSPHNGAVAAVPASHQLLVDGSAQRLESISSVAAPATSLVAAELCPPSGTTTLDWSTSGGAFVASIVDQSVGGASSTGSTPVAPAGTVTYRRLAVLDTGSALDELTVYVGECPVVFANGFESGNTSAWSATQP
ncbi:MAG TPA: hypothetical protein VLA66_06830 [Thermoanaerobaculia bacterium]|nr:hypothetical protein [Thermoanaerobaculia bacterium]